MAKSRLTIRNDIMNYIISESNARQAWIACNLKEIVEAVGEESSSVRLALNELVREGGLKKEGENYTLSDLVRYQISKESQEAEEQRLRELDPNHLASDTPDYIRKAIIEAADALKPHVVGVASRIRGGHVDLAVYCQDGRLLRTTVDLTQPIADLKYGDLVEHIQQLLRTAL